MDERLYEIFQTYGQDKQVVQATEELAELTIALSKINKNKTGLCRKNLIEEIADVQIMVEQMMICFDIYEHLVEEVREAKIKRQLKRIKEEGELSEN